MVIRENEYFIFDPPVDMNLSFIKKSITWRVNAIGKKIEMDIRYPWLSLPKKYKVALCAIFKNEAIYLREWIEYHLIIGVEHFYLYNNFSEDDYENILEEYVDCNIVTLIDWPVQQGQIEAYRDCAVRFSNETQWLGFIDIDEFVVPVKYDDIYSFLKNYEKNRAVVILYWKIFGSGGNLFRDTDDLVTESFVLGYEKYHNLGKCFLNTKYELFRSDISPHFMMGWFEGKRVLPVNCFDHVCYNNYINLVDNKTFPIHINHYCVKSLNEYKERIKRGDAFFKNNPRNIERFFINDYKSFTPDYSIFRYLTKLKDNIDKRKRDAGK